jgi:hypothetical protein
VWCGLTGLLLVGLHLSLAFISPKFAYGSDWLARPIVVLVCIELAAGVLYVLAVLGFRNDVSSKGLLVWAVVVGALLRACMMPSAPVLEDDYYRYLWDGAVVAHGENPYAYSPGDVLDGTEDSSAVPPVLHQLAKDSGLVVSRINHPHLRTIYPPVAQAAFALAHVLRPWSMAAWRVVLLLFDVAALALLVAILRTLKLNPLWLVTYWWNPILIKEVYNSGHMDVLALPFVLGAVLLTIRGRHVWAAGALALAVGTKLWPVALLPIILRPAFSRPKRLIAALCLFAVLACIALLPVYAAALDGGSGFLAYARGWEMNDALFMLFVWCARFFLRVFGANPTAAQSVARIAVSGMLVVWIARLARGNVTDPRDMCERCLLVVAAIFVLSPTQYPWYYLWLLPFLAVRPRLSLLLWTVLLPLYYLRFYLNARDQAAVFDNVIVWIEHVPVWILLGREWYVARRHETAAAEVPT